MPKKKIIETDSRLALEQAIDADIEHKMERIRQEELERQEEEKPAITKEIQPIPLIIIPLLDNYYKDYKPAKISDDTRIARRAKKYNITVEYFYHMLEEQGNTCLCCSRLFDKLSDAHIDHDHTTGSVRGLLCMTCNLTIGTAKDDPERLMRCAEYLYSR